MRKLSDRERLTIINGFMELLAIERGKLIYRLTHK